MRKAKLRSAHHLALTPNPDDADTENKLIVNTRTKDESSRKSSQHQIIPEPSGFIFSGHFLQRKEFQKIIKRLRGRVYQDSHYWSYQATYFIARCHQQEMSRSKTTRLQRPRPNLSRRPDRTWTRPTVPVRFEGPTVPVRSD